MKDHDRGAEMGTTVMSAVHGRLPPARYDGVPLIRRSQPQFILPEPRTPASDLLMRIAQGSLLLLFGIIPAVAGSFVNLNFETSLPSSPDPEDPWQRYSMSRVMLGWTGYNGDQPETAVSINNIFLDTAGISLFTTRVSGPLDFSSQILQGAQSAFLQAGVMPGSGPIVPTTLAQTGTVPSGVHSLQFDAITGNAPFSVSLNGVVVPAWELKLNDRGTAPASTTFGLDLSPYAGQEVDLRFTVLPGDTSHGTLVLDRLQFSANSVPEPATGVLLGAGAVALGLRLRRRCGGHLKVPNTW